MSILFPCTTNGGVLPDSPMFPIKTENISDNVIRQSMDAGPAKQRRRYTAISKKVSCTMMLKTSQKQALDTFYNTTTKSGSLEFEWFNFDDDTSADYRFLGPISSSQITNDIFQVSFELERLP